MMDCPGIVCDPRSCDIRSKRPPQNVADRNIWVWNFLLACAVVLLELLTSVLQLPFDTLKVLAGSS